MNVDKQKVLDAITVAQDAIVECEFDGHSLADARIAQAEITAGIEAGTLSVVADDFDALLERAAIAGHTDQIHRLRKTMAMDLMKVDTRFVITSEDLVCPAGFHMTDRVFVQTTIAIHTDDWEGNKIPRSNVDLKVFDMETLNTDGF